MITIFVFQVRMYIALDQSPLRLSAFKLHDMMTSAERLTHALTVHYLSAAILGAGELFLQHYHPKCCQYFDPSFLLLGPNFCHRF